jgi:hypothetical protein
MVLSVVAPGMHEDAATALRTIRGEIEGRLNQAELNNKPLTLADVMRHFGWWPSPESDRLAKIKLKQLKMGFSTARSSQLSQPLDRNWRRAPADG